MKTKLLTILAIGAISLFYSSSSNANTDEEKQTSRPIREINVLPEEGFYFIVIIDTTTGTVIGDASGYYPAGTPIPIRPLSNGEVLLVQKESGMVISSEITND